MANQSILAAFSRMWTHITNALNKKADVNHNHNNEYYTETEIDNMIESHTEDTDIHVSENDKLILNSNLVTATELNSIGIYTVTISSNSNYNMTNTNTTVLEGSIYNNKINVSPSTLSDISVYMNGVQVPFENITYDMYYGEIKDLEVTGDITITIKTGSS